MIYRIVTYDRTTERMKGSLIVPPSVLAKVKKIGLIRFWTFGNHSRLSGCAPAKGKFC